MMFAAPSRGTPQEPSQRPPHACCYFHSIHPCNLRICFIHPLRLFPFTLCPIPQYIASGCCRQGSQLHHVSPYKPHSRSLKSMMSSGSGHTWGTSIIAGQLLHGKRPQHAHEGGSGDARARSFLKPRQPGLGSPLGCAWSAMLRHFLAG